MRMSDLAIPLDVVVAGVRRHPYTALAVKIPPACGFGAEKDIAAIVDSGAASNVPIELAWKRARDGKLGTRNACYLAFDCFHPQWDPRHMWLVPIT